MGYRDVGGDCLELAPGAAGTSPVNNDLATSVARDCILACVECKILVKNQRSRDTGTAGQLVGN